MQRQNLKPGRGLQGKLRESAAAPKALGRKHGEMEGALCSVSLLLAFCPEPPLTAGLPEVSRGRSSTHTSAPRSRRLGVQWLVSNTPTVGGVCTVSSRFFLSEPPEKKVSTTRSKIPEAELSRNGGKD